MNFDVDYTAAQQQAMITRFNNLLAAPAGASYTTAELNNLRDVLKDVWQILLNDVTLTANDRLYSRGLNTDGQPNAPEYRHEFYMVNDERYRAAWSYDHSDTYAEWASRSENILALIDAGRIAHTYRESDPEIVDRSLLRHALRELEPGEMYPTSPLGVLAPKTFVSLPSLYMGTTVGGLQ